MENKNKIFIILLFSLFLTSCVDTNNSSVSQVTNTSDKIVWKNCETEVEWALSKAFCIENKIQNISSPFVRNCVTANIQEKPWLAEKMKTWIDNAELKNIEELIKECAYRNEMTEWRNGQEHLTWKETNASDIAVPIIAGFVWAGVGAYLGSYRNDTNFTNYTNSSYYQQMYTGRWDRRWSDDKQCWDKDLDGVCDKNEIGWGYRSYYHNTVVLPRVSSSKDNSVTWNLTGWNGWVTDIKKQSLEEVEKTRIKDTEGLKNYKKTSEIKKNTNYSLWDSGVKWSQKSSENFNNTTKINYWKSSSTTSSTSIGTSTSWSDNSNTWRGGSYTTGGSKGGSSTSLG